MAGNYFDRFDEPPSNAEPRTKSGNFFDRYSDPGEAAASARREFGRKHPILRRADAGLRGAADFLSMGWADEIAGSLSALPALMPGGESFEDSQARHIAYERAIDEADKQDAPWTRRAGEGVGFVGTLGLGMLGAAAKGGAVVNTLRSTAAGAGLGALASAGNAEGDVGERAKAAVPGALVGGALGAAAVPVGAAAGAVVSRVASRAQPAVRRAANALRNRIDVDAARQEAAALRDAGVEPSAINVMDDAGRGYVAAAAKRQTPSRDIVQRRADASRAGMAGKVRDQAARISSDPRAVAGIEEGINGRIAAATEAPEVSRGFAGLRVSQRLNEARDRALAEVNSAYNEARALGPDGAHLPAAERPQIAQHLRDSITGYTLEDLPRVKRVMDDFDKLGTLTVKDMFDLRARLSNLSMSNDRVEASAAATLRRALDNEVDGALDRGAITGDNAEAANAWKKAISKRRAFGQLYEGNDLIARLVERQRRAGVEANRIAPEDVSNAIFGRGDGVTAGPNATRDLLRLRDRLGEDSPEWRAIQQEAVSRILGRDAGKETYGAAWAKFEQQNPELSDLLMSDGQRRALDAAKADLMAAQADRRAIELGRQMGTPNAADADVEAASGLSGPQADLARLAMRRQIERRAGGRPAAAIATAEDMALSPEAQARTRALLPEDDAAALERGMEATVRTHRQLQQVAPRTGAPTNLNSQDERAAADLAHGVATVIGGPKAWGEALIARLRTAGLSDDQAAAVADIATDPAQLDDLLARMERLKPGSGAALRGLINDALAPNAGEATQPRASVSVSVPSRPELGVGTATDRYVPGVGWVQRDAPQ